MAFKFKYESHSSSYLWKNRTVRVGALQKLAFFLELPDQNSFLKQRVYPVNASIRISLVCLGRMSRPESPELSRGISCEKEWNFIFNLIKSDLASMWTFFKKYLILIFFISHNVYIRLSLIRSSLPSLFSECFQVLETTWFSTPF